MEKKKQRLLPAIWLAVAAVSRILYFLIMQGKALDTYAYVENALGKTGGDEAVFSSGLAYAYGEKISQVLSLFGNNTAYLVGFQTILQIAWLVLLFFAVRILWGETASCVTGTVLLISPYIFRTISVIEPGNYLMLHLAVLLFLFSVFRSQTLKTGWYRSNSGELFLILIGFYLGVVCTWNYMGFGLLAVMAYVLIQNRNDLSEKIWMQRNLELEEKEQVMPVFSQALIMISGMLVGMFSTLMKYTGLTGWDVWEQLFWWQDQFLAFPGRCQDVSIALAVWLIVAIALGLGSQYVLDYVIKKKEEKKEYEDILKKEEEKSETKITEKKLTEEKISEEKPKKQDSDGGEEEMQDEFFTAKDGRVIKYIENPLPGPKKHVKKEMDFEIHDVEEVESKADDFDYKIDAQSDFDFH